ncbi:hypothetical protein [Agreia bicolorata]|uniref:Uncharacterized protein n=1 Tax=Agreia bicolorata TaxID=110935 RepID=A0ABR5CDF2_9MICO|nr:hypothetical protein [Agreia bicolorata]KJC63591.1 hypothetical protein TZ00_13735 [Agreia bicolorata]
MGDSGKAKPVHRTAISIDVFESADSQALKDFLERRRRILSPLSRNSPLSAQHSSGGRPLSGPIFTWTVFAGNGRSIASSAELFSNEISAERSAITTMARVDDIEVLRVRAHSAPMHAWAMNVDGAPRLIALRYFTTVRLRDRNAASVLAALHDGMVVPPGDGPPHQRMPPPLSPRRITDDLLAEVAGPLKLRGEGRPIRPILRSYISQPVRSRIRTDRDGS